MTAKRTTKQSRTSAGAKRGRKADPNKVARDRYVFALVEWLIHSDALQSSLTPLEYPAGLEPPIGWQDDNPNAPYFWTGSDRERNASALYDWKAHVDRAAPVPLTLKGSHLTHPAIRQMGAAPGIAAYLLQQFVPRAWCKQRTILAGNETQAALEVLPDLQFLVRRLWALHRLRLEGDEAFRLLAIQAGWPAPIHLQPSTIGKIYKAQATQQSQAIDGDGTVA